MPETGRLGPKLENTYWVSQTIISMLVAKHIYPSLSKKFKNRLDPSVRVEDL